MRSSRRDFFKQTAGAAAGVAASTRPGSARQRAAMPTTAARAFMTAFGLRVPIASSGMGLAAGPELAMAVCNAGGLGALGSAAIAAPDLIQRVQQTRAGTKTAFAVNYILRNEPATLQAALDAGAPIIQFSFGIPSGAAVAAIRKAGARFGVQISSAGGARRALDLGADYLICQGTEAGGHVQALNTLDRSLPEVIAEAKQVPVLAAGGITTGQHIRRALIVGASGVFMGTRFIATKESHAHEQHKAAMLRATGNDTVLTICFQDGWIYPHRVIRSRTVDMWEAAGCPLPGQRPGEDDITATHTVTGAQRRRYLVNMPRAEEVGQIAETPLYAGVGVGAVRDIPAAGDLVARLWAECLAG